MPFASNASLTSTDANNMLRGFHRDNSSSSHTGDTVETTLKSVSIPGGTLGVTGFLYMVAVGTSAGTAGTKTVSITLGGTDLNEDVVIPAANTDNWMIEAWIRNTATNAQRITIRGMRSPDTGGTATVSGDFLSVQAIDTTSPQTLAVTAQLANSGDTLTAATFEVFIVQIT